MSENLPHIHHRGGDSREMFEDNRSIFKFPIQKTTTCSCRPPGEVTGVSDNGGESSGRIHEKKHQ
uniref:Uncharacterized protein n=1 Tax=Anopheles minimus TaxID=112268 RepID=A0A182VWN7_9DIPT